MTTMQRAESGMLVSTDSRPGTPTIDAGSGTALDLYGCTTVCTHLSIEYAIKHAMTKGIPASSLQHSCSKPTSIM